MADILVLNGPNLNLLGSREPEVYGYETLDDINKALLKQAEIAGVSLAFMQSNAEHDLINRIHAAAHEGTRFILINPGAYTHTSIALRDAFLGVNIPFIEIHLSNVYAREVFRSHSYLSDVAAGCITGLGSVGYRLALEAALHKISK